MELALRDYPLDFRGLQGLLPCIPLVRTVTINMRRFNEPEIYARYLSKVTAENELCSRFIYIVSELDFFSKLNNLENPFAAENKKK